MPSRPDKPEEGVEALLERALELDGEGKHDEELQLYDEVVERFGDASSLRVRRQVCRALRNKAITLFDLGREEEAAAAGSEVIARFRDESDPEIRGRVLWALASMAGTLDDLDRAIDLADEVLGHRAEPAYADQVVRALYNKAVALRRLGRAGDALVAFREVVERFGRATGKAREDVVDALRAMGPLLVELGERTQALATYDALIECADSEADVGNAMLQRAWLFGEGERHADAVVACDRFLTHFGQQNELAEQIAYALSTKARHLARLGRDDEAIGALQEIVHAYGTSERPELRRSAADALHRVAYRQQLAGRPAEALATLDDVTTLYGDDTNPAVAAVAVRALDAKAQLMLTLGEPGVAVEVLDGGLAQFGDNPDARIRAEIATLLHSKTAALYLSGRPAEAVVVADALIALCESETGLEVKLAQAWQNRAGAQALEEQWEQTVESYDALIARFASATDPELRREVALALTHRVEALAQMGRTEEALEAFEDMVEQRGTDAVDAYEALAARTNEGEGVAMRRQNVGARFNRARVLAALGREQEAVAALNELIAAFDDDDDPFIHAATLGAHDARAQILDEDDS